MTASALVLAPGALPTNSGARAARTAPSASPTLRPLTKAFAMTPLKVRSISLQVSKGRFTGTLRLNVPPKFVEVSSSC